MKQWNLASQLLVKGLRSEGGCFVMLNTPEVTPTPLLESHDIQVVEMIECRKPVRERQHVRKWLSDMFQRGVGALKSDLAVLTAVEEDEGTVLLALGTFEGRPA